VFTLIDKYGDNIQSTCLKGDHWKQRHGQIKLAIYMRFMWAGIPVELEVFNLFSGLIPPQGLTRIDSDRQRQSMVPDFQITLPWEGRARPVLHKLKVISYSKTRHKPTMVDRAVDKRAGQLHRDYQEKERKTDRDFGGVEVGRIGKQAALFPNCPGNCVWQFWRSL
jgi:hypothetical protein